MIIKSLEPRDLPAYFTCLEPWSQVIRDAGDLKARWYDRMNNLGLGVRLAQDDDGAIVGMIQYVPIDLSPAIGDGQYFVLCVWVHGHSLGVGNRQGRGTGSALLEAAERDALARGATGMAAWGLTVPMWMRAGWFRKHGYVRADRDGLRALMYKPFRAGVRPPHWLRQRRAAEVGDDQVLVTACRNGWCPAMNATHERMRRAVGRFPGQVHLRVVDTRDALNRAEWGCTDGLFVDGAEVRMGPPPSESTLARGLAEQVRLRLKAG